MQILTVLADPILPVFAILAIGYGMGLRGTVTFEQAKAINRLAMVVLIPIVVFDFIATSEVRAFHAVPLAVYAVVETVVFVGGYVLARRLFHRPADEAILIAFGTIFANNVFFTLPMAILMYGEDGVTPITAVVTLDATLSFAAATVALEVIRLGQRPKPAAIAERLARTPVLQGIALGVVVKAFDVALPAPVETFVDFNGAAAAPVALFALGVVLSQTKLVPDTMVLTFAGLKLIAMPLMVGVGIALFSAEAQLSQEFVLAAAGPAGAMSISLAMLHGVRTDAIAQLIVITSLGSLFTLAFLA